MLLKEELIQEKGKKEVYKGHQKKKKKEKSLREKIKDDL